LPKKQWNTKKKAQQMGYDDTIHERLAAKQRMAQNRFGNRKPKMPTKPKWVSSLGYIIFIILIAALIVIAFYIFLNE